jgi:NhaP-type Na+/H+ or K+/H+ antiporter
LPGWLAGWLVGWLVGWLAGWLASWLYFVCFSILCSKNLFCTKFVDMFLICCTTIHMPGYIGSLVIIITVKPKAEYGIHSHHLQKLINFRRTVPIYSIRTFGTM